MEGIGHNRDKDVAAEQALACPGINGVHHTTPEPEQTEGRQYPPDLNALTTDRSVRARPVVPNARPKLKSGGTFELPSPRCGRESAPVSSADSRRRLRFHGKASMHHIIAHLFNDS